MLKPVNCRFSFDLLITELWKISFLGSIKFQRCLITLGSTFLQCCLIFTGCSDSSFEEFLRSRLVYTKMGCNYCFCGSICLNV